MNNHLTDYRWEPISKHTYCQLFRRFGNGTMDPGDTWGLYASYTRPPVGMERGLCAADQRTEWMLVGAETPLLANQTDSGLLSYYLAIPLRSR